MLRDVETTVKLVLALAPGFVALALLELIADLGELNEFPNPVLWIGAHVRMLGDRSCVSWDRTHLLQAPSRRAEQPSSPPRHRLSGGRG